MGDFSPHQKKIVERYYENRDDILLARLQEIVSEMYLADTAGKLSRLWGRAEKAMRGLKIPPNTVNHILAGRKPEILAGHVRDWGKQLPGR
ncbi:MAG: hypothetical protein ACYTHJ_07810 [Planctomycetota bacterium]|jgi:hypothetical protein